MQIGDSFNPASLIQNANQQAATTVQKAQTQTKPAQEVAKNYDETDRETFEIPLLEEMSDAEYEAFLRATKGMDESAQVQAAEGLNLLASTYQNAQQVINGGVLAALGGNQADLLTDLAKGDLRAAINQGADVLGRMNQNDQIRLVQLMERMAMALTQNGLNLQG